MPVTVKNVDAGSIGERMGWVQGSQVLSINHHTISDVIDFRFFSSDDRLFVKIRINGILREQEIEKEPFESLGVEVEEFRIKHCGDDCIFCFVDQNPEGLRKALYFRDGDFRMSFLYGNYITMTNIRQRDLDRIVEQRLTPLYISVHCTDDAKRHEMMGHRNTDDQLMQKLQFLREHRIEMHTQVVLVPGYNDGAYLEKTVRDLAAMHDAVQSLSIVPVGLTKHREGLADLRNVSREDALHLIDVVHAWQDQYRKEIGRGFVYLSDEMYLIADVDFPPDERYDGYPLMENGVGMCRDFVLEFEDQQQEFPEALSEPFRLTMVTGTLPSVLLERHVVPALNAIDGLEVQLVVAENKLFGPSVTVSGLLSFQCFSEALAGRDPGDMILLPPDCVNFEGAFMDDKRPEDLAEKFQTRVEVFDGDWVSMIEGLQKETFELSE